MAYPVVLERTGYKGTLRDFIPAQLYYELHEHAIVIVSSTIARAVKWTKENNVFLFLLWFFALGGKHLFPFFWEFPLSVAMYNWIFKENKYSMCYKCWVKPLHLPFCEGPNYYCLQSHSIPAAHTNVFVKIKSRLSSVKICRTLLKLLKYFIVLCVTWNDNVLNYFVQKYPRGLCAPLK